jgi:hypothetical protein
MARKPLFDLRVFYSIFDNLVVTSLKFQPAQGCIL